MPSNEDIIRKAIDISDIADGTLNAQQQDKFIDLVHDSTKLLKEARMEAVDNPTGEIAKLYIGEPITRAAPAGGTEPSTGEAKPKSTKITYSTTKLVSWYDLPTDVLLRNIAQEKFEDEFFTAAAKRVANDLELLAIQGDTTAYASVDTPLGYLLRVMNGWLLQGESSHVIDADAASVSKSLFAKMYRQLPDAYKGDPDLRWVMSKSIEADWLDLVADRLTAAGDEALKGNSLAPYGIPILPVPLIPNNLTVAVDAATAAEVLGNRQGPFTFTSTAKTLKFDIDNAGAVEFSFSEGTFTTVEVANAINTAMSVDIARDSGWGELIIKSPTTGVATSEIDISAPSGNSALTVVGLTIAVTAGTDAGTDGNMPEGSRIVLTNPKNFIWIPLKKTRVFSEFKPRKDSLEVTLYNEMDIKIENLEAMVFATNVRLRTL